MAKFIRRTIMILACAATVLLTVNPAGAANLNDPPSDGPEVVYENEVGEVVPGPGSEDDGGVSTNVEHDYGWVTGTIYFNRHETFLIATGGAAAGLACGYLPAPANGICRVGATIYSTFAGYAYGYGGCLKIKYTPALNHWPDTHYGSRCY